MERNHEETGFMRKTITYLSDDQAAAIELAAQKLGLTLSAFIRMAAVDAAAKAGFHAEQPKAD